MCVAKNSIHKCISKPGSNIAFNDVVADTQVARTRADTDNEGISLVLSTWKTIPSGVTKVADKRALCPFFQNR